MSTLMITQTEVLEKTFTDNNIDSCLIKDDYILAAQLDHIQGCLGCDLYDLLITEIAADVFTGLNETLWKVYIKPALAFYVKALVLPEMRIRTTNKGLEINDGGEFSTPPNREETADIVNKATGIAQTLIDELKRYICDNSSSFPLYVSNKNEAKIKANIIIPKC